MLLAIYGKLGGSGSSDVTHGLHEVSAADPFEVLARTTGNETEERPREGGGGRNRPRTGVVPRRGRRKLGGRPGMLENIVTQFQ